MSLSSLLLQLSGKSKGQEIDRDLDSLFLSTKGTSLAHGVQKKPLAPGKGLKRPKTESVGKPIKRARISALEKEDSTTKATESENIYAKDPTSKKVPARGGNKKVRSKVTREDSEEEDAIIEDSYLNAKASAKTPSQPKGSVQSDTEASGSEDEVEASELVHESMKSGKERKASGLSHREKYVPPGETSEQRDSRTVFIGNLPVEVAQKKSLLKQIRRYILAQVPLAKIESIRLRSVPFQVPTSKLPTSGDESAPPKPDTAKRDPSAKSSRPHDRERLSLWKERSVAGNEGTSKDEKQYLTTSQKKRIAFINQEFHSQGGSLNAYAVLAHPPPVVSDGPSKLPPRPPIMDPYEAAQLAAKNCDGTQFLGRTIRVDVVSNRSKGKAKTKDTEGVVGEDPKLSVFVGNLDFASKEEDLRVYFEGVVSTERGPPPAGEDEEGGKSNSPKTWVTRVRIVRDKDTQLGKGFAYVRFLDRECVDEILALEEGKLKFAKRKLRVQRCKVAPGPSTPKKQTTSSTKSKAPSDRAPKMTAPRLAVPKGDPSLGEKLAHLPKDERKQYKSADADRVARRLAKKKAGMAMAIIVAKQPVKSRDRVRKTQDRSKAGASRVAKSKGRTKSDRSLASKNVKK